MFFAFLSIWRCHKMDQKQSFLSKYRISSYSFLSLNSFLTRWIQKRIAAAATIWGNTGVFSVLPISWSLPILHNLALRWSSTFDVSNLQSIKLNCAKWGFLGFCKVQQKKACSSKNGGKTSIDFLSKNKCNLVDGYFLSARLLKKYFCWTQGVL